MLSFNCIGLGATTIAQAQAHLVGGGIAGLAAAILLVRDAEWDPDDVHIYEGLDTLGGSLDRSGDAANGFVTRGGRMFEEHFGCTFDLLRSIPVFDDDQTSVTDEILRFTRDIRTSSNCRLVADGVRMEAPSFGLSLKDRWCLLKLNLQSEQTLEGLAIEDCLGSEFFETDFWIMWCTMFAFQRWHSAAEMRRYMRRFIHLLPGFNRLEGIHRSRLNQYDSIIEPIRRWLQNMGVHIHLQARVTDITFNRDCSAVTSILFERGSGQDTVAVNCADRVFITLGSITEDSTLGSMTRDPNSAPSSQYGAWPLWRRLATRSAHFGRPDAFAGETAKTQWLSFTVTIEDSRFFDFMEGFTHNSSGTGGLVTFRNSGWLLSVVLAHQPHFAEQPNGVHVFWGYGLHPEQVGDHITKPMLACTGAEILEELAHQLNLDPLSADLFRTANCIPCLMPNITTQFMPRRKGDRPAVVPPNAKNFAFLGQFVEMPDDTVFTVEYSVRSAQTAVFSQCAPIKKPTPVYKGFKNPTVLFRAARSIMTNGAS